MPRLRICSGAGLAFVVERLALINRQDDDVAIALVDVPGEVSHGVARGDVDKHGVCAAGSNRGLVLKVEPGVAPERLGRMRLSFSLGG